MTAAKLREPYHPSSLLVFRVLLRTLQVVRSTCFARADTFAINTGEGAYGDLRKAGLWHLDALDPNRGNSAMI